MSKFNFKRVRLNSEPPFHLETDSSHSLLKFEKYFLMSSSSIPNLELKCILIRRFISSSSQTNTSDFINILKQTPHRRVCKFQFDITATKVPLYNEKEQTEWQCLMEELLNTPVEAIKLWSAVFDKFIADAFNSYGNKVFYSGILKTNNATNISKIDASNVGKLVTVKGSIVRANPPVILCVQMTFSCMRCGNQTVIQLDDGKLVFPKKCTNNCQNTTLFRPLFTSSTTLVTETRTVYLKELDTSNEIHDSTTHSIECVLTDLQSKMCKPGDIVTFTGIVKLKPDKDGIKSSTCLKNKIYIYITGLLLHSKNRTSLDTLSLDHKITKFKAMVNDPNYMRRIVASFCPGIFGNEMVKLALILQLLGGSSTESGITRADINILLLGDPGLGKSQLLKFVPVLVPNAVYVCGSGNTEAGLTATITKEGGETCVTGGALVLADQSICCIDEFDKMRKQHTSLLEAMEQQSVTIVKSGVMRSLSARASVLAAANAIEGHYDSTKTIKENLQFADNVLNRFDLVFILIDTPDPKRDRKMMAHVRETVNRSNAFSFLDETVLTQDHTPGVTDLPIQPNHSQSVFLRSISGRGADALFETDTLYALIQHAKETCNPVLSLEAAAVLDIFYQKMRNYQSHSDYILVTSRQLMSYKRLAEARAKLELRNTVTKEDAENIVELVEFSMSSIRPIPKTTTVTSCTTTRAPVADVIKKSINDTRKKPKSRAAQAKALGTFLLQLASVNKNKNLTKDEIICAVQSLNLTENYNDLIDELGVHGIILNKGNGAYMLL